MSGTMTQTWCPFRRAKKPPTPPEPDETVVLKYVQTLQRDGRLLLRHLARRSDVVMAPLAATTGAGNAPCMDVLFQDSADSIRKCPAKMAELIHTVDQLSRTAQPANVRSIRITSAFLKVSVEDGEPPVLIRREAWRISFFVTLLTICAALAFALAIALLADADYGRRLLQQVDKLRQAEHENELALNALTPSDFRLIGPAAASSPAAAGTKPALASAGTKPASAAAETEPAPLAKYEGLHCDAEKGTWLQPVSPMAISLCRQKDDIRNRLGLAYVGLSDWNCWNYGINWIRIGTPPSELYCGAPLGDKRGAAADDKRGAPPGDKQGAPSGDQRAAASSASASAETATPEGSEPVSLQLWRSHETRVSASIAVMTGFLLPMLMGFLGGCAYVFRRFDEKLLSWSVEPHDGKHAFVRVLIAAMLGGLVAVIWTSDEPVKLGGFSLSLAAVAFFVGFSVEVVFTLIQSLIAGVISTVRPPASNQATAWPGGGSGQAAAKAAAAQQRGGGDSDATPPGATPAASPS